MAQQVVYFVLMREATTGYWIGNANNQRKELLFSSRQTSRYNVLRTLNRKLSETTTYKNCRVVVQQLDQHSSTERAKRQGEHSVFDTK